MGNTSSMQSAMTTHTLSYNNTQSTSFLGPTPRTFSMPPMEPSTFVSITKRPSESSSYGSPITRTGEYCTWNWEKDTSSCSSWTYTVDVTTPFTMPTPTGGYEPTVPSFTPDHYTCTDFSCVISVASYYGFSLCVPTLTATSWSSIETLSWSEEPTLTFTAPTILPTCDLVLNPEECLSTTSESLYTPTYSWTRNPLPTATLTPSTDSGSTGAVETTSTLTSTTSDCDESSTLVNSSPSTEGCEFGVDCQTSIESPTSKTLLTPSVTPTKNLYSYHGPGTGRVSTSTSSDCDLLGGDCTPAAAGVSTSRDRDSTSRSEHTVAVTIPFPHHSNKIEK